MTERLKNKKQESHNKNFYCTSMKEETFYVLVGGETANEATAFQ